jgi:hypothetical protein
LDTDAHTTQVNKYKKRSPLSTYLFGKGKEFVTISSQAVSYANTIIDEGSKAKRKKVAQQLDLLPETSEKLFECH